MLLSFFRPHRHRHHRHRPLLRDAASQNVRLIPDRPRRRRSTSTVAVADLALSHARMASHPQPSPPTGLHSHPHHVAAPGHAPPQVNGQLQPGMSAQQPKTPAQHLAAVNEAVWMQIGALTRVACAVAPLTDRAGRLTELMGDPEGAIQAYEQALRHNQWSIAAMNAISSILRAKEQFHKAVEYLQNILKLDPNNGETWGSLGECWSTVFVVV